MTVVAAWLTALLSPAGAVGRAGDLDRSFGSAGRVSTPLRDEVGYLQGFGRQPGGRFVALGNYFGASGRYSAVLIGYRPDGSIDRSFGRRGRVVRAGPHRRFPFDLLVDPDGRLVTAGRGFGFELARYLPDGADDLSFGSGAQTTTDFPTGDAVGQFVDRYADGRLVVAGTVDETRPSSDQNPRPETRSVVALARYHDDGSLDQTFGDGGRLRSPVGAEPGAPETTAVALAVQADGKLVVAVVNYPQDLPPRSYLVRYNLDGSLDQGFGRNGQVRLAGVDAEELVLQPDGKILVGASSRGRVFLGRYRANGAPDSSFGRGGVADGRFPAVRQHPITARTVTLQPDGRILVAGATARHNADFGIARFTPGGRLDGSFGQGGAISTAFCGPREDEFPRHLVLQPNGKLVVAGYALSCDDDLRARFLLARYHTQRYSALGRVARRWSLRALASEGMRVPFSCSRPCRLTAQLTLGPARARRMGLERTLATSRTGVSRGQSSTVLKVSSRVHRALRNQAVGNAELRVRFGAAGRTSESSRKLLTLSR